MEILEEPLQTPCNHLFCADCIKGVLSGLAVSQRICPLCRQAVKIEELCVPIGSRVAIKREHEINQNIKSERGLHKSEIAGVKLSELPDTITFDQKLHALINSLRTMLLDNPSSKALVFTQFTQTMQYIKTGLESANILYQTIEGHMTMTQRKKALDRFRATSDCNVFLLSVRAGAVGLTLTSADHIFFTEPCINPAIEKQAIGRVHRIGQARNVHVKYLIVNDTIEQRLMKWNSQRFRGKENKAVIKSENRVKQEGGVKREPGIKLESDVTYESNDELSDNEDTGNAAIDSHSGVIPGNVNSDAVPMRLAELEMLFGHD